MTKFEWTKRQVEEATRDFPPDNPEFINAFLSEIEDVGEALTRTKFEEIYENCSPPDDADANYFDYDVLSDHFILIADFGEAWDISKPKPLPQITTKATFGEVSLPDDFCTVGGTPDWIQNEKFPICPSCDADMTLVLQLKSIPYSLTKEHEELNRYTFGDAGNFYLFHCTDCGTHKTSWECH